MTGVLSRGLVVAALITVLAVPAAAAGSATGPTGSGYLVVRKAISDGGVNGNPVVTVVVLGFVLGRVSQEGEVDVYRLPPASAPQVNGADISARSVRWHRLPGERYSGSNFRFSATSGRGLYRVVVRGSGIYIFAGGRGTVWLQGSSINRRADGTYSVNGSAFRSMPTHLLKRQIGRG